MFLLDHEFFATGTIEELNASMIGYLMPCRNTDVTVSALREYACGKRDRVSKYVISNGTKEIPYTIIITKIKTRSDSDEPEKKYIAFATNRPNVDVEKYSKRGGIETGYRMLEKTRVKTSGRNPAVREFCFLYSMLLFNAWVIANAMPYHQ